MNDQEKAHAALDTAVDAVLNGAPVDQMRRNYLRTMQSATRLRFTLAGNTAIQAGLPRWRKAFDTAVLKGRAIPMAPDIRKVLGG
jgi:hypothetical protein